VEVGVCGGSDDLFWRKGNEFSKKIMSLEIYRQLVGRWRHL
jgi:hypothetical protein